MKACPTKAIRIRNGIATIEGFCIDCVECVRVCPRDAIKAVTTKGVDITQNLDYVVSPTSCLYFQFGPEVLPNDVLLGFRRMGFRYVHDQSYTNEIFSFALELYMLELEIKERREKPDSPFPLISPICPVVRRLIAYRFPSLLKHIPPLATPRQIVTREAKKRLSRKKGCSPSDINVLHVTPCPAISSSAMESAGSKGDNAVGIHRIYESLEKNLQSIEEDIVLHYSGGIGLGWGVSGGEIAGLDRNCLAVSGLHETIHYLEMIEMGLLKDLDYIEFRTCKEGCIGGPYTVADTYQTKHLVKKFVRMFGVEKRIRYKYLVKLYQEGWFAREKKPAWLDREPPQRTPSQISKGIERESRVQETLRSLPRKECGACGSPDCRTFAEDVVDGKVSVKSCVFLR
jgi:hypothetical protein